MYKKQHTIAHSVNCEGIGLHSGVTAKLVLRPAPEDSGIVFIRKDLSPEINKIKARYDNVTNTKLGTTLSNEHGATISTIEHLMASLWGCGIDNCYVEVDGPEIPIMDGSAEPFVFLIECAGISVQQAERRTLKILKEVSVTDEKTGAILSIRPSDGFQVNIEIDFEMQKIAKESRRFDANHMSFKSEFSRARTFGFAKEVEYLRSIGLARGGSLHNAVVIGDEGVINKEGLRYRDECVRHKVLDCIGDLYLAGGRIEGSVEGKKSGHCLNNQLLRALFEHKTAWRWLENKSTAADVSAPVFGGFSDLEAACA